MSFMQRCLDLAALGAGFVAPNPMVGAVLVHKGKIIGEGYHQRFGGQHAERNCLDSVRAHEISLIPGSELYVSLEPCAHHGKTPPCADLIIEKGIRKVVIACRDPFEKVNGRGIEKLKSAGVEVVLGEMEKQALFLNRRFFVNQSEKRPYVVLKWAQSHDQKISSGTHQRLYITNQFTNRLVHKWRSEEAAILVGTNTAMMDDPHLTNRLWSGATPVRMVVDLDLRLPSSLNLFDGSARTIVFNEKLHDEGNDIVYWQVSKDSEFINQVMAACAHFGISSILVEGGARLIQSFIDNGTWDEARVITNQQLFTGPGFSAPILRGHNKISTRRIQNDLIEEFQQLTEY